MRNELVPGFAHHLKAQKTTQNGCRRGGCYPIQNLRQGTPLPGFLDFGAWPAQNRPLRNFSFAVGQRHGVLPGAPVACQVLLRHAARVQPPTPDRPHPADSFRCSLFRVREILGLFSGGARHSAARRGARVRTGAFTVRDQHAELERARVCCWSVLVQQPSHDVHCMVHGARALTRLARLARSDRQVPLSGPSEPSARTFGFYWHVYLGQRCICVLRLGEGGAAPKQPPERALCNAPTPGRLRLQSVTPMSLGARGTGSVGDVVGEGASTTNCILLRSPATLVNGGFGHPPPWGDFLRSKPRLRS